MKEFFVKHYNFVKGIILRMIKKFFVTATAGAIDSQMLVYSRAAEKSGLTITSQKISWLIFVETNAEHIDNVKNVVCATAEKMNLEPTGDEFAEKLKGAKKKNPDFFNFFFDSVKNISSEEMRQYWEAILKGELEQPGSMPISVVDLLRKLDKDVAVLFDKLLEFHSEYWICVDVVKQFPISLNEIQTLIDGGFIVPDLFGAVFAVQIEEDGWGYFDYCGIRILVERVSGDGAPSIPGMKITASGIFLAKAIHKKRLPSMAYLARIAKFIDSEEMRTLTPNGPGTGKFRMWVSVHTGGRILFDPKKENGGISCRFTNDGKIEITQASP